MKRAYIIEYVRLRIVDEDSFPTDASSRDVIDTTAEELPSHTRIPTAMLPPPYRALAARIARWEGEGR